MAFIRIINKFILVLLFGTVVVSTEAQKTVLKFNPDGTFKIVQFTDVHFKYGNPNSDIALERMRQVLDIEKPDLVIFTGDVIYGKPASEGMKTVLNVVAERKIPFGVVYGNHDDEQGMDRQELLQVIQSVPFNLTEQTEGLSGVSNYILPVKSADGSRDALILYCLDSHSYSSVKGVGGYDFLKFDQVNWYLKNSTAYTKVNGGKPLPSLAFFHIPLPEYSRAAAAEGAILIGARMEPACVPQLNTGMFAAMKQSGDIMGVFAGHDHDNDYVVYWRDILLAYGRYTGGNTVYNNIQNGARVIELKEGAREFKTWIRQKDGVVNPVDFPATFQKKGDPE